MDSGNDRSGSLAQLQRHLFSEDTTPAVSSRDDQVLVFSAPGESRECVEIARRVLALAREGVAFDRMAVLLRSPEEYRAHLAEAFARAGVPVHFARGAVRPDPAGRAFYVLLRCAAEGLSARRFAEYLSLGQVPDAIADGTPPAAMPRSERWVTPDQELVPHRLAETFSEQVRRRRSMRLPLATTRRRNHRATARAAPLGALPGRGGGDWRSGAMAPADRGTGK